MNNRLIYQIIILTTLFLIVKVQSVRGEQITVCASCNINSIAQGLSYLEDGDTLIIQSGNYEIENTEITKQITIIGINYPELISKSGDEILTILADCVSISGIRFKGVTNSYIKERSAIRIKRQREFVIENNIIDDCFFGIYLERAKNGIVSNNIIKGNATTEAESGNGIHAWYCDGIEVNNNTVEKHRDGIYFEFVNNSNVVGNLSQNNTRYGLHFMFSNDDNYINNTFYNNGVGVAVMFSRRIEMINNHFAFNWGGSAYGLLLKEIYDATIRDNTFEQNTLGIFVEGSNRVTYKHNSFIRNGWAIKFSGGCELNEITRNNFINNSIDLVISTKISSNSIHHNYWSNYSGYDLNKDDIGDIPYYPVKLFYYIIDQTPEAIILMRSLFVDIINFAEKVSPIFTPKDIYDKHPLMKEIT